MAGSVERVPVQLDAAARRAVALVLTRPPSAGSSRVLAIDGPSGSGKTTLARAAADHLAHGGGDLRLLHLEDVYPGWDGLRAAAQTLAHVLTELAGGRRASYRSWDWEHDAWGPEREVEPPAAGGVLVVEGSGCGSRAVASLLSALVWVEADTEVRQARAMARDGEVYRPHWARWAAQEAAVFAAEGTRERADVVVST